MVPESVADPLKYYGNNTATSRNLLEAAVKGGVKHFIFSSTAAVYGMTGLEPVAEETPLSPMSPYGRSKLMTEMMLADVAAAHPLTYGVLRYFNVAGADPKKRSGQSTPERHAPDQGRGADGAGPARPRSTSSAPISRRPTAPGCATTSTSPTWSRRMRCCSTICAAAATSVDAQLRLRAGLFGARR